MNLKELRELLGKLYDNMSGALKKAETEKRKLTDEERTQYKKWETEYNETRDSIELLEKQEEREREVSAIQRRYVPPVDTTTQGDTSEKEERDLAKYSFVKAFRSLLDGAPLSGLEKEMHDEGVKEERAAGVQGQGNFKIPQLVLTRAGLGGERRDMTATGQTSVAGDQGGQLIQTNVGSLIDRLRSKLVLGQLGVQMLNGLQGNIDFPKFVEDDAAVEKAENAASAESSPTLTTISMSPKRLPVHCEVSRQLLLQTSESVEAMLRNDLAFQIAKIMDTRGINGSGSSNQPTGILTTSGIGAVVGGTNGAAPDWADIVDLETAVAIDDADVGALSYLTNTRVRGLLKKTFVDASSNAERVWDKDNPGMPLNGYKAAITNLVPNTLTKGTASGICSAIIFGNFNDAMMGQWGGLDFLINPYSRDTEGLIRINAWTFYDFLVRRAQSFAAMQDALAG